MRQDLYRTASADVQIPAAPSTNPQGQPFDLPGSYAQPRPIAPAWQPPPPPPMMQASGQKQGLAVASLILGIFSITIGWCCSIGLLSAPTAIVLGTISLVQIKNDPAHNTESTLDFGSSWLRRTSRSGSYILIYGSRSYGSLSG